MTAHMDNVSEKLLSKVLGYLSDLKDFQNCRMVSKKWKRNVVEACQNKFHVVYPLTDSTLYTLKEIKETKISFDIYAFTGKENKDVWATSGIEPLMRTTEWIQFTGSEVDAAEIRKFLGLAHNSLKALSLRSTVKNLACPFLEMQQNFSALRKVSLGYYGSGSGAKNDFTTFTNTLNKWISLDCRVALPLLESLNLSFNGYLSQEWQLGFSILNFLRNYVAIALLMIKYKQTLREVQIERSFQNGRYLDRPTKVNIKPEPGSESGWAETERRLEALDDLNLNWIKVSKSQNYGDDTSLKTGIEMSGRPKDLKNFLWNNLVLPFDNWNLLMATLSNLRNVDVSHLTSIKINLMLEELPDPTMVVNLGSLKDCNNLRVLCINITITDGDDATELVVRNVELLPKGISTLHFENIDDTRYTMGMEVLLTQQQMRWIIDNLRDLESFRTSLAIPGRANANENNEQREVAGANDNEDAGNAQRQQQQEPMNRLVNINLDTFGDMLAMPKLKDLKLDMMTARALSFAAILETWDDILLGEGTTLEDVQEYSVLCQTSGYTSTTTTSGINQNFGTNHIYGYATLAIKRNHD